MSIINPIAKIGDVIRGSLLADRPEQIPLLLKSVTERVTAQGGKFYIKNFWEDPKPLSLGYVGVHIKIRMPIPSNQTNEARRHDQTGFDKQERKYILMELQLHIREIMDGTKDCTKEIAHFLYKAPREAEEKISSEIISSSQLVYLTAMTKLLASKEDLKKVEDTLHIIQAMTKADKKMRLVMETAMLLGNSNLAGEWNEQLQVVVPKDRDAVAVVWMSTAKKINKLLNLPTVKMDERDVWTNTATSVDELYANAKQIAPFFRDMCKQAADAQPGCSVNFGPRDAHMIKEKPSLLEKIKADCEEELGRFMTQFLIKIGKSLPQITGSNSVRLESLSALQGLNLSGCNQITDNDLGFLRSLSALQSLNLSECSEITDRGLAHLEHLTELRSLNLSGCRITDRGLTHLENLTGLQSLNLAHCHQITDGGLVHFWLLTKLQSLNLYGCDKITDSGLARAGLQRLNLSHQNSNPVNPSQPGQSTQSPTASDGSQPTKDTYLELLLRLLENPSIQDDSSLVKILEREAQELVDQETKDLTAKQNKSYQLIQKLLIDQKISQFIAKNLRKLYAPDERPQFVVQSPPLSSHAKDEGKRPPVVLGSPSLGSQTSSVSPTECSDDDSDCVSQNLASSNRELELSFLEITEILTKEGKSHLIPALKSPATTELYLSYTKITDSALACLGSLTALKRLNLSLCSQITDSGLYVIGSLSVLTSLDLSNNKQITDKGLASFGHLTALTSLDLRSCSQITDSGLDVIGSLSALTSLDLRLCSQITDKGLASFGHLTALTSLNLSECGQITDNGLEVIGRLFALKSLDLKKDRDNPRLITDKGLASLGRLTALTSLSVRGCHPITGKGLASLSGLTTLQNLDLAFCSITDSSLPSLSGLTTLQSLDFHGCNRITDTGLISLTRLTAIKDLNLTSCEITDRGLVSLIGFTALQNLTLSSHSQSGKTTDSGLASLRSRLTALKIRLW